MKTLTQKEIKKNYPNAEICEGAIIYEGAIICEGAKIREGAIICQDAIIRKGAIICPNAIICQGAEIRKGAIICQGAIIYEGAEIREGAIICPNAIIRKGAIIQKRNEGIVLHNSYKYSAGWYFDSKTNEYVIRLGCFHRTIKEWEKDFDNNIKEFPINSIEWEKRKFTYEFLKKSIKFNKSIKQ